MELRYRVQLQNSEEVLLGMVSDSKQRQEKENSMTVGPVLFSFQGRLSRRDYWLKGFLVLLPIDIVVIILAYGVDNDGARIVSMVIGIARLWPGLALVVKRLHDHDFPGWLVATILVPFVGSLVAIWLVVIVWFLRGTVGKNGYGEDPVQEAA